jgi:malate dehydrogenase (oxaloacetate-decarboxylating)
MSGKSKADQVFRVALRGNGILHSPQWNKGSAFTDAERKAFGLTGRLPSKVNTLDEQCERAYDQLTSREKPISKNTFLQVRHLLISMECHEIEGCLQSMREQNWVLYYSLIGRHLKELMPIIYTPTEVCSRSTVPDYI